MIKYQFNIYHLIAEGVQNKARSSSVVEMRFD